MLNGINQIALEIVTRDTFPIVNVKIKCRGVVLPDIGTVYPNVTTRFYEAIIPQDVDSIGLDLVIWYNNIKSLIANVIVTRQKNGLIVSRVEYLNSKGEVFEHPYQGKGIPLLIDTSAKGYRPELHY